MLATEQDSAFYERELASFIPDHVFDSHTRLWLETLTHFWIPDCSGDVGYEQYLAIMDDLHSGRYVAALFIPFAAVERPASIAEGNEWVAKQLAADTNSRGLLFISPTYDPEGVLQEVHRLGLHGLKCYHTFSNVSPTWEAEISDYLPEPLIKVADEEIWVITLHMVRSRSVAEPSIINWIRNYCKKYPNMKLILAHSARGFLPAHNLEGLSQLTGLDNLYFDTSANCDPIAHQAILRIIGHEKLLYGSDLPVRRIRGRHVAVADSFLFLDKDTPIWEAKYLSIDPVLLGLEHLRSIKWACWSERLSSLAVGFYRLSTQGQRTRLNYL